MQSLIPFRQAAFPVSYDALVQAGDGGFGVLEAVADIAFHAHMGVLGQQPGLFAFLGAMEIKGQPPASGIIPKGNGDYIGVFPVMDANPDGVHILDDVKDFMEISDFPFGFSHLCLLLTVKTKYFGCFCQRAVPKRPRHEKKGRPLPKTMECPLYLLLEKECLSPFNSSALQARSTNIHFLGAAIHLAPYGFYIGFPHFVGPSMRMADFVPKMHTFSTNTALCHHCTSLHILNLPFCKFTTHVFYQKQGRNARENSFFCKKEKIDVSFFSKNGYTIG
jgi:hypothetical protein